jgi:hypothetical protein
VSPNSRLEKGQDCEWPIVRGRHGEKIDLSEVPDKAAHSHDMAYLYGFGRGWYALFNEGRKLGIGMSWDGNSSNICGSGKSTEAGTVIPGMAQATTSGWSRVLRILSRSWALYKPARN